VRVRILASVPPSFKAVMPSESKIVCALSLQNVSAHQDHRAIKKVEELMCYFMFPILYLESEEAVSCLSR
jgi:hypothetical protein